MTLTQRALAQDEATYLEPPLEAPHEPEATDVRTIDTRFGTVEVNPHGIIRFKSGLLGFSDVDEFILVDLDNPKYEQFRILQCVTDPTLSFIVFPPSLENGLIDKADIEGAAGSAGIPLNDLVVLLLVTVRRSDEGNSISLNLRAPVLIDTAKFEGTQCVLTNDKYPVRFTL